MQGSCSEFRVSSGQRNHSDKFYASSYPQALHHLDLLQNEKFREEIGKDEWRELLNQKQYDHWRTWCVLYQLSSCPG